MQLLQNKPKASNMKKFSQLFKSIRFAKLDPSHDKGPKGSSDDEEHYAIGQKEWEQQIAHAKKRAMQEDTVDEGMQQTLRKVVPGYAKREIDKKMDAGKFGKTDADKDANFHRYKKIQDKLKEEQVVQEGRPSQRHPLEGHEYHKKSDAELEYIAKDAHKAAEAMKSHNTTAENKYRDQANDSATVRYFRKKNGMPEWYKKKYGHIKESKDEQEYGYEGDMAMNQLETVIRHATYLKDMMKPDTDLPEWVQSKITLATDYLQTACDYMTSEMKEEVDPAHKKILDKAKTSVPKIPKGEYERKVDKYLKKKYTEEAQCNESKADVECSVHGFKDCTPGQIKESQDDSVPFDGPYTKNKSATAGKYGVGYSTARHLARQAMKSIGDKQKKNLKPAKPVTESKKAEIVKDVLKGKKTKDKFEAEPIISSSPDTKGTIDN